MNPQEETSWCLCGCTHPYTLTWVYFSSVKISVLGTHWSGSAQRHRWLWQLLTLQPSICTSFICWRKHEPRNSKMCEVTLCFARTHSENWLLRYFSVVACLLILVFIYFQIGGGTVLCNLQTCWCMDLQFLQPLGTLSTQEAMQWMRSRGTHRYMQEITQCVSNTFLKVLRLCSYGAEASRGTMPPSLQLHVEPHGHHRPHNIHCCLAEPAPPWSSHPYSSALDITMSMSFRWGLTVQERSLSLSLRLSFSHK